MQPEEVNFNDFRTSSAVNLANPGSVSPDTVNKVDRDRKPRSDDEFILGLDRELGASFAAGVAFTYRKADNWSDAQYRFSGACSDPTNPTKDSCPLMQVSDYTANAPVTANGYTAFSYTPNSALALAGPPAGHLAGLERSRLNDICDRPGTAHRPSLRRPSAAAVRHIAHGRHRADQHHD